MPMADSISATAPNMPSRTVGVRLVASNTLLFEAIVNAAHAANPDCRFVFNYSATSTPDDIRRWYPNPANAIPAV